MKLRRLLIGLLVSLIPLTNAIPSSQAIVGRRIRPTISIQYGTVSITGTNTTGTATITGVTTANAAVHYLGHRTMNSGSPNGARGRLDLTNGTTVTATRNTGGGTTETYDFMILEYASGIIRSNQTITVTITGTSTSGTATITSVTTANAIVIYQNGTTAWTGADMREAEDSCTLTDSTTVTCYREGTNSRTTIQAATVMEFN